MEQEKTLLHQRDMAQLLYGNSYPGLFISTLASWVLAFGFAPQAMALSKAHWGYLMLGLLGLRLLLSHYWRGRLKLEPACAPCAIRHFAIGLLLTALMWCFFCLYYYPGASQPQLTSSIIVMAALAGGGANVLSGHKGLALSYAFILLCPYSLLLMRSPLPHEHLLGSIGLFFCGILMYTAKQSADFTANAIALKHQHERLLGELEEKVAHRTREIYLLSNRDPLTGLLNRGAFLESLRALLQWHNVRQAPLAVLFVDLDGFKKINDTLGHDLGDLALQEVAKRLREQADGAQLGRWGGDEFILAIPYVSLPALEQFVARLIGRLKDPILTQGHSLKLGATVGTALFPEHGVTAQGLIQLADMAMYEQKRQARGRLGLFNDVLAEQIRREHRLRSRLEEAAVRQELLLNYQPLIATRSEQVAGVEALLRWQLDGEEIPPDVFIPLAEQSGQIRHLGHWVLQQACDFAQRRLPQTLSLSVNVSVVQLQEESFMERLSHILANSRLAPARLHLEITESLLASDPALLPRTLNQLHNLGVRVCIDDFGTGYSSLSMMQHLAVDLVKIDRSFIGNLESSGRVIIRAVMQMADSLGYQVVAEGVESSAQAQALKDLGVHYLQGFYYAQPLTEPCLLALLQAQTPEPQDAPLA